MEYKAVWHEDALKDLRELDKVRQKAVVEKVKTYLVTDPLRVGKPLTGDFKGLYRLRFEDYRIIYGVDREAMTVLIGRSATEKTCTDNVQ